MTSAMASLTFSRVHQIETDTALHLAQKSVVHDLLRHVTKNNHQSLVERTRKSEPLSNWAKACPQSPPPPPPMSLGNTGNHHQRKSQGQPLPPKVAKTTVEAPQAGPCQPMLAHGREDRKGSSTASSSVMNPLARLGPHWAQSVRQHARHTLYPMWTKASQWFYQDKLFSPILGTVAPGPPCWRPFVPGRAGFSFFIAPVRFFFFFVCCQFAPV